MSVLQEPSLRAGLRIAPSARQGPSAETEQRSAPSARLDPFRFPVHPHVTQSTDRTRDAWGPTALTVLQASTSFLTRPAVSYVQREPIPQKAPLVAQAVPPEHTPSKEPSYAMTATPASTPRQSRASASTVQLGRSPGPDHPAAVNAC